MRPYPIALEPILKSRVWGGRSLADLGKNLPSDGPIGESWEIADLPESIEDGRNTILNGPLAGWTLRKAIAAEAMTFMGQAALSAEGGFPLLIKYLDAETNLSVQVHPTAAYVRENPDAYLKSEAWVVIAAEPGGMIYKGIKPDVSAEAFAAHIADGSAVDDLIAVPVQPGDCHYLPSGVCHALGAGVLVAEVQTPSDTTFRVYDWGRTGRELHVEQALKCIAFGAPPAGVERPARPVEVDGICTTRLLDTEYFMIERVDALKAGDLTVISEGLPIVWMMIEGSGSMSGGGETVAMSAGSTVLTPAMMDDGVVHMNEGCGVLVVTPASPTRNMIA